MPNAIAANTTRPAAGRAAFSDYNDGHAVHSSQRAVIRGVTTLSELGAIRNLSSPATGKFGVRLIEVDSFGRGAGGIKGGRSGGGGGGKTPPGPERPSRTTGIEQSRTNRIGKGSKTGYTPPTVNYGEPKEQPSKEQPPSKESPSKGSSSSGGSSGGSTGGSTGGSRGGSTGGGGGGGSSAPDEMLPELDLPTPVEAQPAKKKFPWLLAGGGVLALWLVFGDKEGKTP